MLKFNKTPITILAAIAAITMSGTQAALADHDGNRGHDGDRGRQFHNSGYRSNNAAYYNNNGYYNNNNGYYNNGYGNHPRTVKHEIRHVLNNL